MKYGKWLMAAGMTVFMAGGAFADGQHDRAFDRGDHEWVGRDGFHREGHDSDGKGAGAVSAPEIDPSSAVAAVMLAVGGILVIRSRRRA